MSGLEGNGNVFEERVWVGKEQKLKWRPLKSDLGDAKIAGELLRLSRVNPTTYRMGFKFQGQTLPGPAAIWAFGIPIAFGVLGFFIPQVLFKTGNSNRNGSSREERDVEEKLKRIDGSNTKQ